MISFQKSYKYKTVFLVIILFVFTLFADHTLSVLYFKTVSPQKEYSYLPKALAEMLISDLSGIKGLSLVEREEFEKISAEMVLGQSGMVDKKTAPKVGKMLGAEYLVMGSIIPDRRDVAVQYKIVEVEGGRILSSNTVTGRSDRVLDLKGQLSAAVINDLKKEFKSLSGEVKLNKNQAEELTLERADDFGKALDLSDKGEYEKAQVLLKGMMISVPEFTYGEKLLNRLNKRIEEYDAKRQAIINKQKKQPMTYNRFQQMTINYTTAMEYSKLLVFCRSYQDNPPNAPQGSMIQGDELLQYNIAFASYMLKKWDIFLTEGERFLKNYPTSMYYSMIKTYMKQAMGQIERLEHQRKRAASSVKKLMEEVREEKGVKKHNAIFKIAQEYYNVKLYNEALKWYNKVDPSVMGKYGIDREFILYQMFMCYYNLFSKEEAEKIYKALKNKYPESEHLKAMTSLISMFPQ